MSYTIPLCPGRDLRGHLWQDANEVRLLNDKDLGVQRARARRASLRASRQDTSVCRGPDLGRGMFPKIKVYGTRTERDMGSKIPAGLELQALKVP